MRSLWPHDCDAPSLPAHVFKHALTLTLHRY